jgi:hypothetical protein
MMTSPARRPTMDKYHILPTWTTPTSVIHANPTAIMKWTTTLLLATAALATSHVRRQESGITTDSTPGLDSTITVDGGDATTADPNMQIVSAKLSGSGCPQGSVAAEISQQLQSVSVALPPTFRAEKGGDAEQKDATKNCLLQIQVLYPAGQRFTVVPADFAGSVKVEAGVSAALMASIYFASDPDKMVRVTTCCRTRHSFATSWLTNLAV